MLDACPSAETLSHFLNDTLSADEEASIADHLDQCATCRNALDEREPLYCSILQPDVLATESSVDDLTLESLRRGLYKLGAADAASSDTEGRLLESDSTVVEQPGNLPRQVGRFVIEGTLGEGGFGIVLLAFDPTLKRKVALKIPRLHVLSGTKPRQRFLREAQITAALQHAHIVPVFEAGEADGIAYLATEYCPGPTLARWLAEQPTLPGPKLAAQITLVLAEAVEHAHQQGVLHRDIKPGNVLIDPKPASTDLCFTPKLTDFGLARLAESEGDATLTGTVIGTPRYMAPEQAAAQSELIGPATDVYALGALLYELLTGKPPIVGGDNADTLRRIATDLPAAPHQLVPTLSRDLSAIVMKCLEKRSADRYGTAQELADDLARYLRREPTLARPLSPTTRLHRWCRRNPLAAAFCLLVLLVALISPLVAYHQAGLAEAESQARKLSTAAADRERSARQQADEAAEQERAARLRADEAATQERLAREEAVASAAELSEQKRTLRHHLYRQDMLLAAQAWDEERIRDATEILDRYLPQPGEEDLRSFIWHLLQNRCSMYAWKLSVDPQATPLIALSRDGKHLAVVLRKSGVHKGAIYDVRTRKCIHEFSFTIESYMRDLEFSADGNRLLISNKVLPYAMLYSLHDGSLQHLNPEEDGVGCWYLDAKGEPCRLVMLANREDLQRKTFVHPSRLSQNHEWLVVNGTDQREVAWNVWAVSDGQMGLKTAATDRYPGTLSLAPVFSPSGQQLYFAAATANPDSKGIPTVVLQWNHQGKGSPTVVMRSSGHICGLNISGDGSAFGIITGSGAIEVWNLANRTLQHKVYGHCGNPMSSSCALVSCDLPQVWASAVLGEVLIWDLNQREAYLSHPVHKYATWMTASANAHVVAMRSHQADIQIWDSKSGKVVQDFKGEQFRNRPVALSCDGKTLAVSIAEGGMSLRKTGEVAPFRSILGDGRGDVVIAMSYDGTLLATGGDRGPIGNIRVWNIADGKLFQCMDGHPITWRDIDRNVVKIEQDRSSRVNAMAFSPDGQFLGTSADEYCVRIWDVVTGQCIHKLEGHKLNVPAVTFSSDSKILASSGLDSDILLHEVHSGKQIGELKGHRASVSALACSPDGKTLASGSYDSTIRLWHLPTRETIAILDECEAGIRDLCFIANGRTLVALASDGKLHCWRTER